MFLLLMVTRLIKKTTSKKEEPVDLEKKFSRRVFESLLSFVLDADLIRLKFFAQFWSPDANPKLQTPS